MKRTPLARRTPLPGGKPLARTVPLSRKTQAPRQPAQRVQGRRTARPVPQDTRETVRRRSGGRCEVAIPGVCHGQATNQHHRLPRRMGGSTAAGIHAPANLLDLCGSGTTGCHGHLESHRSEALEHGWLLHAGADPATVPALIRGRRVLLTAAGGYLEPGERAS